MDHSEDDGRLVRRFEEVRGLVDEAGLFERPRGLQGPSYSKPVEYLAIAFMGD